MKPKNFQNGKKAKKIEFLIQKNYFRCIGKS